MKRKIKQLIYAVIRRGYWFNNVFFQDCRKFRMYKTFNTDVINLGSTSAVAAFNYEGLNIKGANWAMSRNPLLGDYAILRNYCSFLKPKGSIVIISLCPFSAFSGSYDYLDDRYYKVLYPSSIPNYSFIHDVQVTAKWENPILHYPWYAIFTDIWKFIIRTNTKNMSEAALRQDADSKFNSWCQEFSIQDFSLPLSLKNKDGIDDAVDLLLKMASFCKDHGCKPVFVVPPVYKSLAVKFSPTARNVLFNSITERAEFKDIKFLNYMDSENFAHNRTLFKDSFLLNEIGSKIFTKQVLLDLKLI